MDRDLVIGALFLGVVLVSAITFVVLPKLKKKKEPILHDHDPYMNQYNQPHTGVMAASLITSFSGSDSSSSN